MPRRIAFSILAIAAIVVAPSAAQPGGGLSTPNFPPQAGYGFGGSPSSQTDVSNPSQFLFYPTSGVNQLAFNWWSYHIAGDSVQRPFGTYQKSDGFAITGTSNWPTGGNGTTSSYNWTEFGPPAGGIRFTAAYTLTLSSGPTMYDAKLSQSFQINNPNSVPLTISLFDHAVWEPGGHTFGLSASGGIGAISVTDGTYNDTHMAIAATAYQAAADATLGNLLYGGTAADLNNAGLPIVNTPPGSLLPSTAFEWTLTIPADGSAIVQSELITARAVPEPGTMAFTAAAAAGLFVLGRRRLLNRNGCVAPHI